MAIQLTTDQAAAAAKFEAFFLDENTTTASGKLIDKGTLVMSVDLDGQVRAKALIKNATAAKQQTPFININMQNLLNKKPVTLPKADPVNVWATWNMRGVCIGNSDFNLVNVVS